eukprot:CAMPEP_0197462400 /NCGR_PEP_ID=MMETSP1175-20131217/59012_1 /TAXON_ID=1003142 /ORGANISM="Triceratium dubium, Strain CCMP147" /LENGTH=71 /DNA_ID=CAMNT_0042997901 /DNA_START=196 /DNA_END=411 /DNA_ORIENTATION=+
MTPRTHLSQTGPCGRRRAATHGQLHYLHVISPLSSLSVSAWLYRRRRARRRANPDPGGDAFPPLTAAAKSA